MWALSATCSLMGCSCLIVEGRSQSRQSRCHSKPVTRLTIRSQRISNDQVLQARTEGRLIRHRLRRRKNRKRNGRICTITGFRPQDLQPHSTDITKCLRRTLQGQKLVYHQLLAKHLRLNTIVKTKLFQHY